MTRQEIANDMRKQFNGQSLLNQSQIARYLGWGSDTVRKTFAGVDFFQSGKEKKMHVLDLAKRLEEFKDVSQYG